jgi:hypothetical protein
MKIIVSKCINKREYRNHLPLLINSIAILARVNRYRRGHPLCGIEIANLEYTSLSIQLQSVVSL